MAQRRALGGKVEVCPIIVGLWQLGGGHGRIGTRGVDRPQSVDVDVDVEGRRGVEEAEGTEDDDGGWVLRTRTGQ